MRLETKAIYVAEDGTEFQSEDQCLLWERREAFLESVSSTYPRADARWFFDRIAQYLDAVRTLVNGPDEETEHRTELPARDVPDAARLLLQEGPRHGPFATWDAFSATSSDRATKGHERGGAK